MFVVELPLSLLLDSLSDVMSFEEIRCLFSIEETAVLVISIVSDEDDDLTAGVVISEDFLSPSISQDCSTADAFGCSVT